MQANLNALGIILAPIFAIAVSMIWGTKPDDRRFLKAVLITLSVIVGIVIILMFLPQDLYLTFRVQLFLPVVCLFPILWLVEKRIIRYFACITLLVWALCLSIHYEYLARSGNYSFDDPRKVMALNNFQRGDVIFSLYGIMQEKGLVTPWSLRPRDHLENAAVRVPADSNAYPEGWLSESPLLSTLSKEHQRVIKEHCVFARPQTYRLWHSPFTHIYEARKQYLELWYPGGKLSGTTIDKISIRERCDVAPKPAQSDLQQVEPNELSPKKEEPTKLSQKEAEIDALAECDSGWRYFYGRGVQQDYSKAAKCFRRAIKSAAKHPEQNKLGWCYYRGKGIEPDYADPVTWFRKEADKGNADAQYFMGWLCFYGSGKLKPNRAKAVMWWKKSAEQGFAEAQYELAVEYFYMQRNHSEGIKWQYKAAQQGFDMAQRDIEMYLGSNPEPNYPEGVKWLIKAAGQGSVGAQADLVALSERGWISMVEGYKWALIAVENGREDNWTQTLRQGSRLMGRKPMTPDQIAQAEELARNFKEAKSEASARAITTMYQAMTMREETMDVPEFFFPGFW